MIRRLLAILVALTLADSATAQMAATLVADEVLVTAEGELIARGNVEVFHDGTRLSAEAITYDRAGDRMTITGPILIVTPDGAILTAREADLDPRLEGGMLLGARLVLERELQLAANRIDRVEGRYSQLHKAAVTSCRVCGAEDPLWEIRASRVIHDEVERQLYFENAQLRVAGLPILWLPRMRLPDPTLDRATGFLIPQIRGNDRLGTGLRIPYFIRLGDSRDLTLTPFIAPQTRTLEFRYRQAFDRGFMQIGGAASDDTLRPEGARGYLTATGAFLLDRGALLSFDLEAVSDDAYLSDYGVSNTDRLDSEVALTRIADDSLFRASVISFRSLRAGDDNEILPGLVGELRYERRFAPDALGGTLTLAGAFDSLYRPSRTDGNDGRDVARLGFGAGWQAGWIGPAGIVAEAEAALDLDYYGVAQDQSFNSTILRTTPAAALTLRWPLAGQAQNGALHLIEPVVQLAWSESYGGTPPNEDSVVADFDAGNLLALSRFAGEDLRETGTRAAIGLTWTRTGPGGLRSTLSAGRVFDDNAAPDGFSDSSGLSGETSDWLVSGQIAWPRGLTFDARALFDESAEVTKSEARLRWTGGPLFLSAAYVFLPEDAAELRTDTVSEWTLDGAYRFSDVWAVSGNARYDLIADRAAQVGLAVEWRNECVTVGLSASRRFASSTNVATTTDFGVAVALSGFSAGRSGAGPARQCGG